MGPAKNMSKKPFFEKNERITNVFRIAGVQSTQQFGIRRLQKAAKDLLTPKSNSGGSML